ncbi:MAG TPA: type II toxin-antitoxin system VapB family antitoxin [Polyangia bacterium]|jgi:Arc/MetJ family transcription regulator
MRTTLNLDEALLDAARKATGQNEKTALIHLGLRTLVDQASRHDLALLAGSAPRARAPRRQRDVAARNGS